MSRLPRLGSGMLAGLVVGLCLGAWLGAGMRPLQAGGGERPDGPLVVTGPIASERIRSSDIQVNKDAVYYLNYSKGRILAAVPMQRQTASATQILSDFAERDLVRDFELPPGSAPQFVMTTGTLGGLGGESWAPLYVFEATTGQLGIYRVQPQAIAGSTRPNFQLLERRREPGMARVGTPTTAAR